MKRMDGLQRLLYLLTAVLAIYILCKGGSLIRDWGEEKGIFDEGTVQRRLEDAAMRTYMPGYTAVVEERQAGSLMGGLMQPVLPVFSYLAERKPEYEEESETGKVSQKMNQTKTGQAETNLTEAEEAERAGTNLTEAEEAERAEWAETNPTEADQTERMTARRAETDSEEAGNESDADHVQEAVSGAIISETLLNQLRDFDYLVSNYYIVDGGTSADEQLLDADRLLGKDLRLEKKEDLPQILIYHTHSQEAFIDSEEGNVSHTVVGMGEILKEELEQYGYTVIHDTGVYDLVDGVLDRSAAYDYARESVQKILQEYPSVEVVIDLHRDGVEGKKFVTEIDGKPASMIMFFNGISRNSSSQELYWLENPYIEENLAFSLQLQLKAEEQYPGFTRNIYLKAERYNLHLRPRSLLIEAGTQLNTVEEEQNAMVPLADLLHQVLSGENKGAG